MSLAGTKLSKIKKLIAQVEKISDIEDPVVSFEFLIGSLYPEVFGNVQETIRNARIQGYIDGSLGEDWTDTRKGIEATMFQSEIEGLADTLDKALDEITEMANIIDDEKQYPTPLSTEQEELFVNLVLPRLISIIKICQAALLELHLKGLVDEDVVNYRKTSMFLIFPNCDFKCEKECGRAVCQNSSLAKAPILSYDDKEIIKRYIDNPLTHAIVIGGLEPFYSITSMEQVCALVSLLRDDYDCLDDIVIYTGYTEAELTGEKEGLSITQQYLFQNLTETPNIVIKFGRYRPDDVSHYDSILGLNLASLNQYAKRYDTVEDN